MALTTAPATVDRRAAARSVVLALLLLGLVATTLVGLRVGLQVVTHRSERAAEASLAAPTRTDLALGEPVRTSFGALTASVANVNNGLSPEDLGGMSHGVAALVKQGAAQVEVVVTIANTRSHPIVVAANQFRLVTRKAGGADSAPMLPTGTTLLAGPLPAGASIDTRVSFVVPTDGSAMWLEYLDPGLKAPVRIALGRTDRVSAPKGHDH